MYRPINWSNPINRNHGLNKGLLAWWLVVPQWNGGTVWRDLAGGRNNGTLTNMASSSDWVTQGDRRGGWGALDFDGTDDYIETGLPISSMPFSVSLWYKADAPGADCLWSLANSAVANSRYYITIDSGGDDIQVGQNSAMTQGGPVITAGIWHHVVGVFKTDALRELYSDGVFIENETTATSAVTPDRAWIGRFADSTPNFEYNGQLDDVRIHDRALSAKEIGDYFRLSKSFYPGLLNRRSGLRGLSIAAVAAAGRAGGPFVIMPNFPVKTDYDQD